MLLVVTGLDILEEYVLLKPLSNILYILFRIIVKVILSLDIDRVRSWVV